MKRISVTLRSTVCSDGTVTKEDDARLSPEKQREFEYLLALDEQYPTLYPPEDAKLYEVNAVITGDTFVLNDGSLIKLAGVTCPDDSKRDYYPLFAKPLGISYAAVQKQAQECNHWLEFTLEGKKVAILPQSEDNDGAVRAYLWTVDHSLLENPELKDSLGGPMYSCVNETVLMNGWCLVDTGQQHSYAEKYLKLQATAKRKKYGLWE